MTALVVLTARALPLARRLAAELPAARIHGLAGRAEEAEVVFADTAAHLGALFAAGTPIVGLCAAGILVRALAPHLSDKTREPPVLAVAEDGSAVVPLLGGHRGANALARRIGAVLGIAPAITTAGDLHLGVALDEPPPGWRIVDPARVKDVAAALLAGEPVSLAVEAGDADWLTRQVAFAGRAVHRIRVSDRADAADDPQALVYRPPVLALGVGCSRDCPADELEALARAALAEAGLAAEAVAAVVSVDIKSDEPAVHALAARLGVPARFFPAARLNEERPRLSAPSEAAFRATGCWGVAEGAALAAAGAEGALVVTKRRSAHATCAIARAPRPLAATATGVARGRLAIIGIGPGAPGWRTREAEALLAAADEVVGYRLYLDLIAPLLAGKTCHASAIGAETERARLALERAAAGAVVALVSSGDAGIYGLATLVHELIDGGGRVDWRRVEVVVSPGVSAMQAAAARVGAPLGHDFCAISLSDLLTPWPAIERRLQAAAAGDFVVALYNPRSEKRDWQLAKARDILLAERAPETPVVLARNLGRSDERLAVVDLGALDPAAVDMLTVVIVGSRATRLVRRDPPRLYTPRGYEPGVAKAERRA